MNIIRHFLCCSGRGVLLYIELVVKEDKEDTGDTEDNRDNQDSRDKDDNGEQP